MSSTVKAAIVFISCMMEAVDLLKAQGLEQAILQSGTISSILVRRTADNNLLDEPKSKVVGSCVVACQTHKPHSLGTKVRSRQSYPAHLPRQIHG